jgi:hypothetical protein
MTGQMTDVQKINLRKGGMLATVQAVQCAPYRGTDAGVFDPAQRELNKVLYPHLFRGDR